jgi:X-Pro dipeptidyl-peptidase (S15 family)
LFASPSIAAEVAADDGSLPLDAGEITHEGYVNQRRVLTNRAALAEPLNPRPGPAHPGGRHRRRKDSMMRHQKVASPDVQNPGAQSPGAQSPGAQSPGAQSPGAQSPGAQSPGAQSPGAQSPDGRSRNTAPRPLGRAAAAASKALSRAWSLPPQRNYVAADRNVRVPMSDGTVLLADHYLPITTRPAPTVLVRCPYGRRGPFGLVDGQLIAERGYHVLLQSCRGTFGSGGQFEPMRHEASDGQDTVAWLRGQSWFDGRLRLQVAGGAHPRFARNPGNGQVDSSPGELVPTRYGIGPGAGAPSVLLLSAPAQATAETAGKAAVHA